MGRPAFVAASTIRVSHSPGIEFRVFIVRACEAERPTEPSRSLAISSSITAVAESGVASMTKSLHIVASRVNTLRSGFPATICSVKTPGDRLSAARLKAGFSSARDAALSNGWKESTYRAHEGNTRGLDEEAARRYARRFKVNWLWLLHGDIFPQQNATVRVRGHVGAGAEITAFADADLGEEIELPPGAVADLEAVIVRGTSMFPRYFDGEVIYYSNHPVPPDQVAGKECVVALTDGRMFVKQLQRGRRKNRFNLMSWNAEPIEEVAVEWASPVRWRG